MRYTKDGAILRCPSGKLAMRRELKPTLCCLPLLWVGLLAKWKSRQLHETHLIFTTKNKAAPERLFDLFTYIIKSAILLKSLFMQNSPSPRTLTKCKIKSAELWIRAGNSIWYTYRVVHSNLPIHRSSLHSNING